MNYRLNFPIKTILENISQRNWPFLRKADQLIRSRKAYEVFCGFGAPAAAAACDVHTVLAVFRCLLPAQYVGRGLTA